MQRMETVQISFDKDLDKVDCKTIKNVVGIEITSC